MNFDSGANDSFEVILFLRTRKNFELMWSFPIKMNGKLLSLTYTFKL